MVRKGVTGAFAAVLAIVTVAVIVLSYGFTVAAIGGPGSPGKAIELHIDDYTRREALLAGADYLQLALRYSAIQGCYDEGGAGGVWWDRSWSGPTEQEHAAAIAGRAGTALAAYSKRPYQYLEQYTVELPAGWNMGAEGWEVVAAGDRSLSIERTEKAEVTERISKGEEFLRLELAAEFRERLPVACIARYTEAKRVAPLLAERADGIAAAAVAGLPAGGTWKGSVARSRLAGFSDAAADVESGATAGQRALGELVALDRTGKTLQQLWEAAEAGAKEAEVAAESELAVTAAVAEARVRIKPSCGYAVTGEDDEDPVAIEIQCAFAPSAAVTVDASVSEPTAYPVWNREAVTLAELPLKFSVVGRAMAGS